MPSNNPYPRYLWKLGISAVLSRLWATIWATASKVAAALGGALRPGISLMSGRGSPAALTGDSPTAPALGRWRAVEIVASTGAGDVLVACRS